MQLYKETFNLSFPTKTIIQDKRYIKREPWITIGILTSMRHRTQLFTKKLNDPTTQNIETYKTYNNRQLYKKSYENRILQKFDRKT